MAEAAAAATFARVRRPGRPRLLHLYLLRGVAGPFLLILLAVTLAMMLERALRLIHELAATGSDIAYFFPLLLQLVPYYLDLALPAAFMVALALLVARLDDRLELEAMLASGLPMARIAAPLVGFGLAVAAASLLVGGWLDPHGRYTYRALKIEALNAGRIGSLQPQAIYQPSDRLAVTFDGRTADGGISGVFVWQSLADGRLVALSASSGRIGYLPEGRLFGVDLGPGRYVAWRSGADRRGARAPSIVAFDRLALREPIRLNDASWARGWDQKELTLTELVAADAGGGGTIARHAIRAEIYSRLAHAAINPLLPLLVLPLAFATKKGRRTLTILVGIALLAAVHHGLNLAKNLALSGSADPLLPVAAVMGAFAAVAILIFASGRHLPSHGPIHDLLKPIGQRLAVPRQRRGAAGRGATLSSYLVRHLAKSTLVALLAITLVLQLVDLLERSEQFIARGLGLDGMAHYALLRFAPTLQQAIPVAALAGAIATFASLGRSREMTAIRAAGVSQWRIMAMALPVPLLLGLVAVLLAEVATPRSQLEFARWWQGTAQDGARAAATPRWFRIGREIVRAEAASNDGRQLAQVQIYRRAGGLLSERVGASTASFTDAGWSLAQARIERFAAGAAGSEAAGRLAWPTPLRPQDVAAYFAASPQLGSSAAAYRSLNALAPVARGAAPYRTRILRSFAEPLAPLVMLLLALPLAFAAPRTGSNWPAMLYAGAGGLLYLVADGVLTVAAQVGYLPAPVGACAAPAIGGLIGLTVLLYSER